MKFSCSRALLHINQELSASLSIFPHLHYSLESFKYGKIGPTDGTNRLFYPKTSLVLTCPTSTHFSILKETLSLAFEDFDFTDLSVADFCRVDNLDRVRNNISWQITSTIPSSESLVSRLFEAIDIEISSSSSTIYKYESQSEDVFSKMGGIWSYTYFFINDKKHKVLMLHLREGANDLGSDYDDNERYLDVENIIDDRFGLGVFQ